MGENILEIIPGKDYGGYFFTVNDDGELIRVESRNNGNQAVHFKTTTAEAIACLSTRPTIVKEPKDLELLQTS